MKAPIERPSSERPHLPVDAYTEWQLRKRIANAARYHERLRSCYSVNWLGKQYISQNTDELVDLVITDLVKHCTT
jgi:hypothetical protein